MNLQELAERLKILGDLGVGVSTFEGWEQSLPTDSSFHHPMLYRFRTIRLVCEAISKCGADNSLQAQQKMKLAIKELNAWVKALQQEPEEWHLVTPSDDNEDLLEMFSDSMELAAEELANWEVELARIRWDGFEDVELDKYDMSISAKYEKEFREQSKLLSRGRAIRAGIEALILCTHDVTEGNRTILDWSDRTQSKSCSAGNSFLA